MQEDPANRITEATQGKENEMGNRAKKEIDHPNIRNYPNKETPTAEGPCSWIAPATTPSAPTGIAMILETGSKIVQS